MHILIVDNHDSFVYNIVGLLRQCALSADCRLEWTVIKNEDAKDFRLEGYDAVVLSPGPGLPSEAKGLMAMVERCAGNIPMLGICLGCQAIAEYFGAKLRKLERPMHGHITTLSDIDMADPLVGSLEGRDRCVGRYHSWVVDEDSLPDSIAVTARDEDGNIMVLRHRSYPVFGVQFHPESLMTVAGGLMMERFLALAGRRQ